MAGENTYTGHRPARFEMDLLTRCDCRRYFAIVMILMSFVATGIAGNVILVQGTVSAPNDAERRYSRRLTSAMSHRLKELGVSHRIVTDEEVTDHALRDSRVAMLVYNPNLQVHELTVLQKFVGRGGRLIVFYSSDRALAKLMHVTLGGYVVSRKPDQWTSFRMNESAPPAARVRVSQTSRNIRPVRPIPGKSAVIGYWEDPSGTSTEQPAWLSSASGFWMTHVLLDDGDSWNKKRLILALLGSCDPEIWKVAARAALAGAGTLGRYANLDEALGALAASGKESNTKPTAEVISSARAHFAKASALMDGGDYAGVIDTCNEINRIIVNAYCRTHSPWPIDMIGAWNHSGSGLHLGDWARTCATLKSHGITDVFPNFLWPGSVHYDSKIQSSSDIYRFYGDQPAQCVAVAHAAGLKVHAWKVCWRLDRAPETFVRRLREEHRLQVTDSGQTIEWLCPSVPENRVYEKDAIRELVRKYDIDGIHLDYIRYPDSRSCYCRNCRNQFESHIKRPVARWPGGVRNGSLQARYTTWRAEQVTQLVRDVAVLAKRLRPGIQVSAAVYGTYPQCINSVGQDWGKWVREGYVDFVCPMNYTDDTDEFLKWTRKQMGLTGIRDRIYPGIGCTASESRLDAVQTVDQIAAAKLAGASGVMLFDLTPVLESEILPFLIPPKVTDGK